MYFNEEELQSHEERLIMKALAEKDLALAQANRHKDELFQKLAEKDREISSLQAGYRQELGRHKDDIHKLIVQQAADSAAYQQLMEKAVRFAERLDLMDKGSSVHWNDVEEFLQSPEAQAWKEQP